MAIKKSGGQKPAAAKPAQASSDALKIKALEEKIKSLEGALSVMKKSMADHEAASQKEHAELRAECKACCDSKASSSGIDADLRAQLKRYFATVKSNKVATIMPKL